jgi:hypothetical protein
MDYESTPQPAKAIRNEAPNFERNVMESAMPFIYRRSTLMPHETGHKFDANNQPVNHSDKSSTA